jgi:CO/xanthine dehydrogenase Mo-binding subunit
VEKLNFEPGLAETVGRSVARIDALEKVTGQAFFPGDLDMDGQVYLKVLFARRPHARILGMDSTAARARPGVLAVLTAQDVPVNLYGIEVPDQPVLCGDKVRFYGDRVALVVAENAALAAEAADLVRVEYEDLPVLDGPEAALSPGAPILHAEKPDNVLVSYHVEAGDLAAGFAEADLVLEETYSVASQEHAYLQPDAGLAWIDAQGRLVVQTAGQWAQNDQRQIARSLALPEDAVRVMYTHIGGAFGGREDVNLQMYLALAAWKVRRPVKAIWSREETTIGHPKRHPICIRHRWGATAQGKLVAQEIQIVADAGAYASTSASVLGTTVMMCTGPYVGPNVRVTAKAVYTNNPVSGAFRGFGAPQAVFAAEAHMTRLASALSLDPVELRLRNMVEDGSSTAAIGCLPPGVSARQTLEAASRAAGWVKSEGQWRRPAHRSQGDRLRGVGIAAGWKPLGYSLGWPDEATVTIELHGEASMDAAIVRTDVADVGQGAHTAICQMAAQALGLPLERVRLIPKDELSAISAGAASASRLTMMVGKAVMGAAEAALLAWEKEDRPATATYTYTAPPTRDFGTLGAEASAAAAIGYLAQAVTIEVDRQTGYIAVEKIISAHEVGKAVNPQALLGQVQGGAIQGLGGAVLEDFVVRGGRLLTTEFSTYLIPTVLDVPADFEAIILEDPSSLGPWGAVGVGELPVLAIAPAIFAALHDAAGVWCNQTPLTQERVWRLLRTKD